MIDFILPLLLAIVIGVFEASETALVSIERIKVLKAKREKKQWAIKVDRFLRSPERFFSTILVCENFIFVIATTFFARFFVQMMGDNGIIISTVAFSLFSLLFSQFTPKSIALAHPQSIMTVFSSVIYYLEVLTYPIVWAYANITKRIILVFKGSSKTAAIHQLDIVHAMSEYEEEASRLTSRLFNFSKRTVGDVMIPLSAAFMCEKDKELATISKKGGRIYTRIPVYERTRDNIIGIFNIKDYLYSRKILLREPFIIKTEERCMAIFLTMKQEGEHMAIVTDRDGHEVGIVTLEDLIEELVGEIRDEK